MINWRIDDTRPAEWNSVADKLACVHKWIPETVRGLGRLDAKLILEDKRLLYKQDAGMIVDLLDHSTLCHLWVLGSYEVVRTVCQDTNTKGEDGKFWKYIKDIRSLRDRFATIRIPLAKHDIAKVLKDQKLERLFDFGWPLQNPMAGLGWMIGQDHQVYRIDLSDEFLSLLQRLPK